MPAGPTILRLVLILAVLGNCLPCFSPEDANHDRRIDLSDAIAQVRNLVEAAHTSEVAGLDLQKAILAVSATVGLSPLIAAQPPIDRHSAAPILDFPFFISYFTFAHDSGAGIPCLFEDALFSSISTAPALPPPRDALDA